MSCNRRLVEHGHSLHVTLVTAARKTPNLTVRSVPSPAPASLSGCVPSAPFALHGRPHRLRPLPRLSLPPPSLPLHHHHIKGFSLIPRVLSSSSLHSSQSLVSAQRVSPVDSSSPHSPSQPPVVITVSSRSDPDFDSKIQPPPTAISTKVRPLFLNACKPRPPDLLSLLYTTRKLPFLQTRAAATLPGISPYLHYLHGHLTSEAALCCVPHLSPSVTQPFLPILQPAHVAQNHISSRSSTSSLITLLADTCRFTSS